MPLGANMVEANEQRWIQRRINTLLRDRDAIRRMLEQADYSKINRDVGRQTVSLEKVEALLAGEEI